MIHANLWNPIRCKSGSVAVGTALIAPLLILMISGVADLGRATYDATSLVGAVRAGAQYALRASNDDAGIKQAVKAASTLPGETVTVTTQQFCECPDGSSTSCSASTCGAAIMRKFVRVSATAPFSKIMASSGIVVPSSLSAQAVVRTQ